jgi:phage terminase large subunit-like protein
VPYDAWTEDRWLHLTPGPVVDYSFVKKKLEEFTKQNDVRCIGYDDWGAKQFAQELEKDGYNMVVVRQGHQSLAAPSKEFESAIISGNIRHDNNPCMQWQVGNVTTRLDANNNIVPDKKRSVQRIDGVMASIMAIHCAMRLENEPVQKARELKIHVF